MNIIATKMLCLFMRTRIGSQTSMSSKRKKFE